MTDFILMGYFIQVQVSTISRSVKYRIMSITVVMDPRRISMLQREMFSWTHLESISNISLIGNFRDRVGCLGVALR